MDGVDPRAVGQIEIVRPGEESDEAVRVGFPDPEGEFEGGGVDLNVVVADGDCTGGDGAAGKESDV